MQLVQKSFSRLLFNDFLRNARCVTNFLLERSLFLFKVILWTDHPHFCICSSIDESAKKILAPFESLTGDESYQSRDLEKVHLLPAIPFHYIVGSDENEVQSKIYVS